MYNDEFKYELESINSLEIRKFTLTMLENAPDYFWKIPASNTGKYHPKDELGEGGTVLHTRKAVKIGNELCRAFNIREVPRDCILSAILIHDLCKNGYPDNAGFMVQGHGYLLTNIATKAKIFNPDQPEVYPYIVLSLASTHMGRWDHPYSTAEPSSTSQLIVQLADYFVSRRYVSIDLNPGVIENKV